MVEKWRSLSLRLADYDPARAGVIERESTLTEIAEAIGLRKHDHHFDPDG